MGMPTQKCSHSKMKNKASVTSGNNVMQYIGSTSWNVKTRFDEHKTSFPSKTRKLKSTNCTGLAKYL